MALGLCDNTGLFPRGTGPGASSEMTDLETESRRGVRIAIALVVAATLVAVWLVPEEPPAPVAEIPEPGAAPGPESMESAPAPEPAAPVPPQAAGEAQVAEEPRQPPGKTAADGDAGADLPEGAAARAWLAAHAGASPAAMVEQARVFRDSGRAADAWLLLFRAAREGDAEAALALAEQADPAFFRPETSAFSRPDLVQARKWYLRAAELGAEEAAGRLAALRERLAERAAAGDEAAALLLQEWKSR